MRQIKLSFLFQTFAELPCYQVKIFSSSNVKSYKNAFFSLGSTPCEDEQSLRHIELQEKKSTKRLKHTGNLFRRNLELKPSVNFRLKAI